MNVYFLYSHILMVMCSLSALIQILGNYVLTYIYYISFEPVDLAHEGDDVNRMYGIDLWHVYILHV